jgi:hypothetical protein
MFSSESVSEQEPYINELIRSIQTETSMLDDNNKLTFYESLGHIVKAEANIQVREQITNNLLESLYVQFQEASNRAKLDTAVLNDENFKIWLIYFLKIN